MQKQTQNQIQPQKRTQKMTGAVEHGTLLYGIEYPAASGKIHKDFTIRLPTIGDNIAALEECGPDSNLKINVFLAACCLLKLGKIPPEEIDSDLLTDNLIDEDFDVIMNTWEELRKKLKASSAASQAPDLPPSSSDSTALAPNTSAA